MADLLEDNYFDFEGASSNSSNEGDDSDDERSSENQQQRKRKRVATDASRSKALASRKKAKRQKLKEKLKARRAAERTTDQSSGKSLSELHETWTAKNIAAFLSKTFEDSRKKRVFKPKDVVKLTHPMHQEAIDAAKAEIAQASNKVTAPRNSGHRRPGDAQKLLTKRLFSALEEILGVSAPSPGESKKLKNVKQMLGTIDKNEPKAAPLIMFVCPSALRAAAFFDGLRPINQKHLRVAKLFGRHFKAKDQAKFLAQSQLQVCVGTPNRIRVLVDMGALSLERCSCVVIDIQPNAKGFSIFETKETSADLKILYQQCLKSQLQEGLLRFCLL